MKAILLSVAVTLIGFAATVPAQTFSEGTHYEVLDVPKTTTPEVVEYFSFYCIACFRFEPIAAELASTFPNQFRKSHTSGLSPAPGMGEKMTQAYALALMLEKDRAFNREVFDTNFANGKVIRSQADLFNVFEAAGIKPADYKKYLGSFSVRARAKQMEKEAKDRGVTATPTFIVNGKYKININGFRDSGNLSQDLVKAIRFLLSK